MSEIRNGRSPIVGISMFSARESHKFYTKVQYNYVRSVVDAGGLPWLVPTLEDLERAAEIAESLDALVLTGGEDMSPFTFNAQPRKELGTTNHYRDRWELALLAACENRGIPILGICRGIQVMNVHRRGTLYQDINAETESVLGHALSSDPMESLHHTISIDDGSLLYRIFETEELLVNSFHHQAVRDLGEGLTVTSTAADGIIEGVEDPSRPFYLGVQFHAEALPPIDSYYLRIFSALVESAEEGPHER
jgi:putative glutamine amidotransferase